MLILSRNIQIIDQSRDTHENHQPLFRFTW